PVLLPALVTPSLRFFITAPCRKARKTSARQQNYRPASSLVGGVCRFLLAEGTSLFFNFKLEKQERLWCSAQNLVQPAGNLLDSP
ncbi:MAG: hypothetical protein V4623_01930, partial [Pseudomonadota bacterium]